eukprot:COSAG03_NODE_683_length_6318_cov_4.005467_2_plen_78_part_00
MILNQRLQLLNLARQVAAGSTSGVELSSTLATGGGDPRTPSLEGRGAAATASPRDGVDQDVVSPTSSDGTLSDDGRE